MPHALVSYYLFERGKNYFGIEQKPKIRQIDAVLLELFLVAQGISAAYLSKPSYPGTDTVNALAEPPLVHLLLLANKRSWSDDAHISPDHVKELRKLVKTALPQEVPHSRDVSLVIRKTRGRHILWCVSIHSSEFVADELLATSTSARLLEYRAALAFRPHCKSNYEHRQ